MKAQKVYIASLCLLTFYILSIFFVPLVPMVNDENITVNTKETEEKNIIEETETQSPSKIIPRFAANYQEEGNYPWWDPNFSYRIPLQINSTFIDRINYTVRIQMNFTKYLKFVNWSGTFDEFSVRVIEYNETPAIIPVNLALTGSNRSVIPSLFIKSKDTSYSAQTNAFGQLVFQMNGNSTKNTNRTFMVYFDIIENNHYHTLPNELKWNFDFNWETDVIGLGKQHLAYGSTYATPNYGSLTVWDDSLTSTLFDNVVGGVMNYYFDVVAGDFDGNGEVELMTSDRGNYFHVMDYNPSTGVWNHWKQLNLAEDFNFESVMDTAFGNIYDWVFDDIAAADIDRDGCTEIIATFNTGNTVPDYIVILNFTKSGSSYTLKLENYIQSTHNYNNWRDFSIADFNKDGNLDIVVGTWSSGTNYNITVYINRGLQYTPLNQFFVVKAYYLLPSNPYNIVSLRVGDIDFDGNVEIIQSDNDQNTIRVLEYVVATNSLALEGIYTTNVPYAVIGDMADIDNDGRVEIVVGNYYTTSGAFSSMAIYEVKGDRDIPMIAEWINTSIRFHRVAYPKFGDVDNDGTVEFVGGSLRRYDNTYYPKVLVYNVASTNPEWMSPEKYQATGETYGSQLNILGGWGSKVLRREPALYIYNGEVKDPDLSIQVLDIDKAPVQNVKVHVENTTWSTESTTDPSGQVRFTYLQNGLYDLELNITSDMNGIEQTVFTEIGILMNNSLELTTIRVYNTSIWQMAFDMKDLAGTSVPLGHILVYNGSFEEPSSIIANISTANGWKLGEKFVWFNRTDVDNYYNISAYYNNPSYNPQITQLNQTTALQTTENINIGWFNNSMRNTDYSGPHSGSGDYKHIWNFYANGSSGNGFGNQRLNWANISINNVATYLYKVEILLLLEGDDTRNVGTYDFTPGTVTNWNKEISLWSGGDKGYGLRIFAYASNQTGIQNNGTINVTLEEEYTKTIIVPLAKYQMNFIDSQGNPAAGIFVRVYNDSVNYDQKKSLVNLTTSDMGDALGSAGNPFWYLVKPGTDNYTVKVYLAAGIEPSFCNASEFPGKLATHYNFSLKESASMNFQAQLDMSQIFTKIYVIQAPPASLNFLSNVIVRANVTAQSVASGFEYNQSIAATVTLRVYNSQTDQIILTRTNLNNPLVGIYEYTLNPQTDGLALALNDYNYYIEFSAITPGYGANPSPERRSFTINPIQTSLTVREGLTTTQLNSLDLYWSQKVSVSAYFYNTQQATTISQAAVSYKAPWNLTAITLVESATPGYYQFELDTTDAGNVGQYTIEFFAQQTNYTSQNNIKLYLNVKPLKTMLNGTDPDDILFTTNEIKIFKTKAHNLSLVYWDNITDVGIVDAVTKHYIYHFTAKIGNKTDSGEGDLIEVGSGIYILDFDTEYRDEGTYFFEIQIAKPNYVAKVASISLNIDTMPMIYDFGKALEGGYLLFAETQGAQIELRLNLVDRENGNTALIGSTVSLQIGSSVYNFKDNEDGTYSYIFDTSDIDAFAAPVVLTGKVIISKANYTTIEIPIQITVEMPEIFPGVPTFYFSIILGAVVLLVGTLTMNKVIQNARIPAFVKLIDKTGKLISGKKALEEGKVAPSVEQDMVERFSKDWTALDLNLGDILGTNAKAGSDKAGPGDNPGGA